MAWNGSSRDIISWTINLKIKKMNSHSSLKDKDQKSVHFIKFIDSDFQVEVRNNLSLNFDTFHTFGPTSRKLTSLRSMQQSKASTPDFLI